MTTRIGVDTDVIRVDFVDHYPHDVRAQSLRGNPPPQLAAGEFIS